MPLVHIHEEGSELRDGFSCSLRRLVERLITKCKPSPETEQEFRALREVEGSSFSFRLIGLPTEAEFAPGSIFA
jgi:hypothetical protein